MYTLRRITIRSTKNKDFTRNTIQQVATGRDQETNHTPYTLTITIERETQKKETPVKENFQKSTFGQIYIFKLCLNVAVVTVVTK